ncbi:MAG: sporulation protein YqfC [Bacillota bacterium]|nr:sporulation protein YqfC [Bacillota bacterium]
MDGKFKKTKESIVEKLDLPREVILDIPKITITGNDEITIENHKGVIRFEDKEVKINSNVGAVSIHGKKFEILFIGGNTIVITGKFKSVVYEGNDYEE